MSTRSRLLATLGAIVLVASACGGAAGPNLGITWLRDRIVFWERREVAFG